MTKRNLAEEWKLEETGDERDEWKLEPAEQKAASQWQLRDAEQAATEWQPIDYQRERSSGGNWVLPSLVGVALVAVIAYAAWIGLNRMGLLGDTGLPPAEPTAVAAVADVAVEPTATVAPTDTPAAPSPTPEPSPTSPPPPSPTPIPVLSLQNAVVNAVGGVNVRREPNTTAEVIRILPQGERFLVLEDRTDWVQVAIGGGELGWVAGEFVDRTSETLTYEEANERRIQAGLPALVPPAGPEATTSLTGTVPVTEAVSITTTTPPTSGLAAPDPAPATTAISATVNITVGLNAREEPNITANIVQLLASGSSYSAVARSADNLWVQLMLPDGRLAWAFVEFLALNGDIASLPVGPLTAAPAPAASAPLTETTSVTSSTPLTGVIQAVSGVTASVTNLSGTNARIAPNLEQESIQLLPFDAVLPVIGRNSDGQWIQVALEEGRVAWVLANTVSVNSDVMALPVVNP